MSNQKEGHYYSTRTNVAIFIWSNWTSWKSPMVLTCYKLRLNPALNSPRGRAAVFSFLLWIISIDVMVSRTINPSCASRNFSSIPVHPLVTPAGWPRRRENREFGCLFFQTGKTQGICQKILKIWFYTRNLPPTQEKFWSFKIKIPQSCDEIKLQFFDFWSK